MIMTHLTRGGGGVLLGDALWLGDNQRVVPMELDGPRMPSELGRGRMAPLGRNVGVLQRGMRPAGVIGPARQAAPVGVRNVKRKSAVRPLSAEAVEFSPTIGHKIDVITGQETSGAGGVAPAVVADVPVLTEAGVRFSAVAEVHASAMELDDDVLVVQASEQRAVCSTDPGRAPRVGLG